MAKWEDLAHNYLGFPEVIPGTILLAYSMTQAATSDVAIVEDEVLSWQKMQEHSTFEAVENPMTQNECYSPQGSLIFRQISMR